MAGPRSRRRSSRRASNRRRIGLGRDAQAAGGGNDNNSVEGLNNNDLMRRTHLKVLSTNRTWRLRSLVNNYNNGDTEAETRPCSISPTTTTTTRGEDRDIRRIRTRSELLIDNNNTQNNNLVDTLSGIECDDDTVNDEQHQQQQQPLGKRPRLSLSPKVGGSPPAPISSIWTEDDNKASQQTSLGDITTRRIRRSRLIDTLTNTLQNDNTAAATYTGISELALDGKDKTEKGEVSGEYNKRSDERQRLKALSYLLPSPQVYIPQNDKEDFITGIWKSIVWEVNLNYDIKSGKVCGEWGPLQTMTAYLKGDRLVNGLLKVGNIELSEAIVDIEAGNIKWGTGEVWIKKKEEEGV